MIQSFITPVNWRQPKRLRTTNTTEINNEPMREVANDSGSDQVRYKPQKQARSLKFQFKKKRDCTIYVTKTKGLISFAVTAKLVCTFVFAYANCWFSHAVAHNKTVVVTYLLGNNCSQIILIHRKFSLTSTSITYCPILICVDRSHSHWLSLNIR